MSAPRRVTHSRASRASTATPVPVITVTSPAGATGTPAAPAAGSGGGGGGAGGGGSGGGGTTAASTTNSTSPMSNSTRTNRLQEKADLQNLNDRLACYIERMRNLESGNSRLRNELQSIQETTTRDITNIKSMYENELSAARKLLDELSREKAKLEIDTRNLWEQNDDLGAKLEKVSKDLTLAEHNARNYEARYNDINGKYINALNEQKKAQDVAREETRENDRLRKQLDDLREQLEQEMLSRVDLENSNQSLREELIFKEQVHSQELIETRSRRQVEISEIDGRLSKQYEIKLHESLKELREQYESQMRANREEIELLYQNEMKNVRSAANRAANASVASIEELRMNRMKIDDLNRRIDELETTNTALNGQIRELENVLDRERARHNQYLASLEAELNRMRNEMANQLQEYQDLMDIKVSLDLEIAAYDKLLCGEECRLNISSPSTSRRRAGVGGGGAAAAAAAVEAENANVSGASSGRGNTNNNNNNSSNTSNSSSIHNAESFRTYRTTRAIPTRRPSTPATRSGRTTPAQISKRRRTLVIDEIVDRNEMDFTINSTAKGCIQIQEADIDGHFIKLINKGNNEINLTGWQLIRIAADNDNELAFKFTRSTKIDGGNGTLTVWSIDAGIQHEPPHNIVMKKKWPIGENVKSVLVNSEKEEVAIYEQIKSTISTHSLRQRSSGDSNGNGNGDDGDGTAGVIPFASPATGASLRSFLSLIF